MDDELRLPPPVPKDARVRRGNPQFRQVQHVRLSQNVSEGTAAPKIDVPVINARAAAVRAAVAQAEDVETELAPVEPVAETDRTVRLVEHQTIAQRLAPKNPLREE